MIEGCEMRKDLIILALLFSVIFLVNFVSALNISNARFNGEWQKGTTLYTNWYNITNGSFYGKNAYPIKTPDMNEREEVCNTTYQEKRKRVCETEITGYKNRTRKICWRENRERVCETTVYQVPIKKRVCYYETYFKPYTKCRYVFVGPRVNISCQNPSGISNALYLENFWYKINGGAWNNSMPTKYQKINVVGELVWFRVDIPVNCSPEYDINKNVFIEDVV